MKLILSIILLVLTMSSISAQYKNRSKIPEKYKWNLADLYESNEAWLKHYDEVAAQIKEVEKYKGKLGESAETLNSALDTYMGILKGYYKLLVFSRRQSDEDVNISANQELVQKDNALGTKISEATAYIGPELLKVDDAKIAQFFKDKPELETYRFFIEDNQRLKAHTLSDAEEAILASAGMLRSTAPNVYNIFSNSEQPFPKVKLSTGEEVTLDNPGFVKNRVTPNREDRAEVFKAKFNSFKDFQNTLGANLAGKLKTDWFFAKSRKYNNSLEASLNSNNIPNEAYTNLIKQVNKNLPTLHRFLELKKRMLGLEDLHYYDLYMPIVKSVDMKFTVDEAQKILLEVFEPMGEEYVSVVKKSFDERWIDYYPTPGKRSGAYSHGAAYDEHPYVLMNWVDTYNSLSTLAHELGHLMHSYMSNKNQQFAKAFYATFVAEIASTINENFLNDYLVENAKTDEEKLYLLGSYLELLRTTIFRQTSFAEFEWQIHTKVEKGEPLTGEVMSDIYYDIVKRYYGHDEGVCVVDDYIAYEWAYILHFVNYTYYVYQYSTSLIYATAIGEKIKENGDSAIQDYYHILKGGGSDYPIELVKKAGVDPLASEAFDITIKRMNDTMDQIEAILAKQN